jgi:hypothetical protein
MKKLLLALVLYSLTTSESAGRGITSPYVTEGKNVIFTDGFYAVETDDASDYRFRKRLTTNIGVTDQLGVRFRISGEQTNMDSYEPTQLELSFRYELADKGEYFIDNGIFGALLKDTTGNDNNALQLRYLFAKEFTEWKHVGNFILQKNFGEDLSTTRVSLRFGSLKKLDDNFSLGYQYFGDYGTFKELEIRNNKHSAGPWLTYSDDEFFAEAGILAGLTDEERDVIFQWRFGVPF